MEARGKIFRISYHLDFVTVYTQYGYATVDLEKFKDGLSVVQSNGTSPEKLELVREESKESTDDAQKHALDSIIEVQFKWGGYGYFQVSPTLGPIKSLPI
jgi:hypothetical protein